MRNENPFIFVLIGAAIVAAFYGLYLVYLVISAAVAIVVGIVTSPITWLVAPLLVFGGGWFWWNQRR